MALLRRYVPLLAVLTLLGALAGYGSHASTDATYRTTAQVLYPQDPATVTEPVSDALVDRQRLDANRIIENETHVLTGDAVRALVRARVGAGGSVRAEAVTNADVLRVTATASTGERAAELANATADAYVQLRTEQLVQAGAEAVETATAKVAELDEAIEELRTVESETQARPPTAGVTLEERRSAWLVELRKLESSASFVHHAAPSVLNRASTPARPQGTSSVGSLLLGMFGGAVIALIAAYVLDALRAPTSATREA